MPIFPRLPSQHKKYRYHRDIFLIRQHFPKKGKTCYLQDSKTNLSYPTSPFPIFFNPWNTLVELRKILKMKINNHWILRPAQYRKNQTSSAFLHTATAHRIAGIDHSITFLKFSLILVVTPQPTTTTDLFNVRAYWELLQQPQHIYLIYLIYLPTYLITYLP